MHKLNSTAAVLTGILLLITTSNGLAANYRATSSSPSNDTTPRYKGETQYGRYKGEVKRKPIFKPAPRPVMEPIFLQQGPYVGIGAGYDSYKVQENTIAQAASISANFNPTINSTGIIGEILAGYGHYFNNALYLGGEVFLNISEATQSTNADISDGTDTFSYNSKFLVTTGYGVAILPGVKLSDSALVYMHLGYQIARLRGQENGYIDGAPGVVSNTSSWDGGFAYGLGFEEAMVENFSLRGEFVHTDYRSFNATSGTQYSPSNNQFMLALIYHIVM